MNYGKKITKLVNVNFLQAMDVLETVRTNGQLFRVDFRKRTDGTMRTMVCQCGVRKGLTGTGAAYSFKKKGLLSVYEAGAGHKAIPIDGIAGIKQGGVWYSFTELQRAGGSEANVTVKCKNRTVPAYTSPLLSK